MSSADKNEVLVINDCSFAVGPNNISIQQENLSYRFQTLRESGSSKIPSGHGMAAVTITIPILKEDILAAHRLRIQIARNPFVYIENKLIRNELAPTWSFEQKMALAINSFSMASVASGPGRFTLEIVGLWFNYKPYGDNFTFKSDWQTKPYAIDTHSEEQSNQITTEILGRRSINSVFIPDKSITKIEQTVNTCKKNSLKN